MSKKKVLIAAAILVAGGAAIAVSAPGQRLHDRMMDRWSHDRGHGLGMGLMGFGRGDITRAAFDEKVRERFARFDVNSDGIIDASEIEAGLAKRKAGRHHRGFRERRADRGDAGKGEARRGRSVNKSAYLDEVRRRFAMLDLDSNGRITDADLPPRMRDRGVLSRLADRQNGMRGHRQGRMLGFLRGAKVDQDGSITLDEAVRVAGERFDRMDRNKDGTLDRADREMRIKEATDYRVKRVLHRFSAAADGKITREQAFKVAGDAFTRLDRNNDGTISRNERPGGWRGHRGHDRGHHWWRGRDRGGEERGAPESETKKI
jgi:Ca2+-binding EF-hand superfamily protein